MGDIQHSGTVGDAQAAVAGSGIADFVLSLGWSYEINNELLRCFRTNDPLRRYVWDILTLLVFNRKVTRERRWFASWRYRYDGIRELPFQIHWTRSGTES